MKWLPHSLCRSLTRGGKYVFDNDGMTVGDSGGCLHMCRNPATGEPHRGRQFPWHFPNHPDESVKFDGENPRALNDIMAKNFPWDEFLVDTSSCFRDNQAGKKELHAPFWREPNTIIDGVHRDEWIRRARADPAWTAQHSPFPLPSIARGLVGMTAYRLRDSVRQALEEDKYVGFNL